ncbi:MAG: ABC transporter substrate-binding protein [Lachnospiraceae bacterium]|nr:ABC transporter substrate-binding protein [Lachnospiraceae bacterium]
MKKKLLACILSTCMLASLLVGCNGGGTATEGGTTSEGESQQVAVPEGDVKGTINLYAFTDEVPKMVDYYVANHPDFGYQVNTTIIATTEGAYQPALDLALAGGGADAPDIYCAEAAFVLKYCQGDMAEYAASYEELGIDVNNEIKKADIAQYSVEIGTRPSDGKVVGLGYQATGGAFIYNRSVAKDTWGTDDPATVAGKIGAGSGNWDQFWLAAEDLKAKGYAIVSGDGDIWHAIENSSNTGWLDANNALTIDAKREAFLDISKELTDSGYHNDTQDWTDAWYADMKGAGEKKVLGFFGPAWLINYVMAGNSGDTYGDWAVCASPVGFFWGGTWLLAGKTATSDPDKAAAVAEIIQWITLDCTEDGLQYAWANGTIDWDNDPETPTAKDCVASGTVMAISDGSLEFLGGQNMFDAFIPANANAKGDNLTQYDERINQLWRDQVREYTAGNKSREDALNDFKNNVKDELDLEIAE